jgi:hypothetical protein
MKDRAVRLIEVPATRDTLKLSPGLTTGMAIGPQVAQPEPAVVRTIRVGTEVGLCIDGTLASPRESDGRRWRPGRFGTRIGTLGTGLAQGFVEVSREWFEPWWSVCVGAYRA